MVLATLASLSVAQAGLIDLLRGDSAAPTDYQRVAFVGSATVREVSGQAERLVGIDRWKPITAGAKLAPGDVLRTGNGTVVLRMSTSGSFVKVTPQTLLRLVPLEKEWDRAALSGSEERNGFVVRSCRGKAYARTPGSEWENVEVNSVLALGSEVRTEPGTVLDLFDTSKQRPLRIRGTTIVKLHEQTFANRVLVEPNLVAANRP
jgi:hypothetical protein